MTDTTKLVKMRFDAHILNNDDEESRRVAMKTVIFLSTNIRRFADISTYVRDAPEVEAAIEHYRDDLENEVPDVPRYSTGGHLSVQAGYYDVDIETVCDSFVTDATLGLTAEDAATRVTRYGLNELPKPEPPKPIIMFLLQFKDFMIAILLLAAIGSLFIGEYKGNLCFLSNFSFCYPFDCYFN